MPMVLTADIGRPWSDAHTSGYINPRRSAAEVFAQQPVIREDESTPGGFKGRRGQLVCPDVSRQNAKTNYYGGGPHLSANARTADNSAQLSLSYGMLFA